MAVLSIVIPTLNCATEIPAHIKSMESWLDLVDEIIVVDSYSEDGTPELIRDLLKHPKLRIISHPKGLYQSWNFGIQQTVGKWIYISTIGDTIERKQLTHMIDAGDCLGSDVVISPPTFIFDDHIKLVPPVWPICHILEFHNITEPAEITPIAAFFHAMRNIPNSILGSSASNLYRGDHLRPRPFPTDYYTAGDTGWAVIYGLETRFCFTAQAGSVFRFHSDTYSRSDDGRAARLTKSLADMATKVLGENPLSGAELKLLEILDQAGVTSKNLADAQAKWGRSRKYQWSIRIPWYLRPSAMRARAARNACRQKHLDAEAQAVEALTALKSLPVKRLAMPLESKTV